MLPRPHRVRRPDDFRRILRRGRKAGRRLLSVHALAGDDGGRRAGFVVGRSVGGSVERHRVTRRLRHLVAARLDALPEGTALVVRAHPAAATATSAALAADLDAALRRLGVLPGPHAGEPVGPTVARSG
ncbi:ribonuclease P protein component [Actinomycetospora sp. TBRC 11914]|uniref:ribonuclease P protein component n=1 Tax=Actinomycetospora sp. TBRC 11914 TaxID=2729387 RepID=UPI00145CD5E6|nr:ribonuclease P protein component [Actinomycetospora sp. TBRC 11914]NMO90263.1 ribonuclease P protein component [Actinomycetospora sp. TBRC 11914]